MVLIVNYTQAYTHMLTTLFPTESQGFFDLRPRAINSGAQSIHSGDVRAACLEVDHPHLLSFPPPF